MPGSPYQAPIVRGKTNRPSTPTERQSIRSQLSFQCSIAAIASVATMIILIESPILPEALFGTATFPFLEVVCPLVACGFAVSGALIVAAPLFFRGQFRPLFWLVPTLFCLAWIATFYDWAGVIAEGQPWRHCWRDPKRIVMTLYIIAVLTFLHAVPVVLSVWEARSNLWNHGNSFRIITAIAKNERLDTQCRDAPLPVRCSRWVRQWNRRRRRHRAAERLRDAQ